MYAQGWRTYREYQISRPHYGRSISYIVIDSLSVVRIVCLSLQNLVKGLIDKRRARGQAWDDDTEVRKQL